MAVRPGMKTARPMAVCLDREYEMNLTLSIGPIAALIAGILILLMPRLLNFIVAIYLIVIGLVGLFGSGTIRLP
jgi:hypothetical protein